MQNMRTKLSRKHLITGAILLIALILACQFYQNWLSTKPYDTLVFGGQSSAFSHCKIHINGETTSTNYFELSDDEYDSMTEIMEGYTFQRDIDSLWGKFNAFQIQGYPYYTIEYSFEDNTRVQLIINGDMILYSEIGGPLKFYFETDGAPIHEDFSTLPFIAEAYDALLEDLTPSATLR